MVYRNAWLGKSKLLIVDLIVNIILDYFKKTVHNLITTNHVQIYKAVFCERIRLNRLNKMLEKYLGKSLFLAKLQVSNEFIHTYFSRLLLKV